MSDETPTPADEPVTDAPGAAGSTEVATVVDAPVAVAVHHAEPVTFRSKFLMPLIVPVGVAATIIFYILNVSRVFLAVGGALAVTYASVITVLILAGGSALAGSPKVRSSSLTLILGFGFLVLLMGGLISIGAASPTTSSGPVQCAPIKSKITIEAGVNGLLRFGPAPSVKAGCTQITLKIVSSSHTLQFDDASAANAFQQLNSQLKSWAGVLTPGPHPFHCTISGHESAGMVGVLTVTS